MVDGTFVNILRREFLRKDTSLSGRLSILEFKKLLKSVGSSGLYTISKAQINAIMGLVSVSISFLLTVIAREGLGRVLSPTLYRQAANGRSRP